MKNMYRNRLQLMMYACLCLGGIALLLGCPMYQLPGNSAPVHQGPGRPPTITGISAAPNPTYPGSIIDVMVNYVDPEGDLEFGVAAVSVNGSDLSRIAFRSTYVSGILTIPVQVSYFSRPSDLQIVLRIRDSAGNWSNSASTVLSIR